MLPTWLEASERLFGPTGRNHQPHVKGRFEER